MLCSPHPVVLLAGNQDINNDVFFLGSKLSFSFSMRCQHERRSPKI